MTSVWCWKLRFKHLCQQLQPEHWFPLLVWVFTGTLEAIDVGTHLIHSCRFISRPIRIMYEEARGSYLSIMLLRSTPTSFCLIRRFFMPRRPRTSS